jgi:oligopeptide/dipeptide ABC transporter ATP-binding protein
MNATTQDAKGRDGARSALVVEQLAIDVDDGEGGVRVVDDVGFTLARGAAVALVGESGAGKSLLARALVGLLPRAARVVAGRVVLPGRQGEDEVDVVAFHEAGRRQIRGARIAFVMQDPRASADPLMRVGDQVGAALRAHRGLSPTAARAAAARALEAVGLDPSRTMAWPHELSSGELQRAALAAALIAEPDVVVADEPTSALDATVAADVLGLLQRERARRGLAVLLVTHDLGVAAAHCEAVHVMVAGRIVESGPVATVFRVPRHPFTRALLATAPARALPGVPLPVWVPAASTPRAWPTGCRYRDRCPDVADVCSDEPRLVTLADRTHVRCARIGDDR